MHQCHYQEVKDGLFSILILQAVRAYTITLLSFMSAVITMYKLSYIHLCQSLRGIHDPHECV